MTDWLPSLNALRAFEAVSRHLNYRKAADELHVSPGAVKQLVKKLEEAVGMKLLEKQGRGIVLTEPGALGKEGLSSAFRQINDTVIRMRAHDQSRRLIVTIEPSIAAAWLVPRLEQFKALHSGVEILIDSSMQIVDMTLGLADVAIRYAVDPAPDMVTHRLFDEDLRAYCSPVLADGSPRITRIEDLAQVNLLRWDLSSYDGAPVTKHWNQWRNWLAELGANHVVPGEGTRFSDYNLAVQAAVAGQGMIIGSAPILRDLIEAGLLITPLSESAKIQIGYDLVTTETAMEKPGVAILIDWILQEARR